MACGQEGHFRPECPLVSSENRTVQDPGSPQMRSPNSKAPPPKRFPVPKGKAAPQAKGIIEDAGLDLTGSGGSSQDEVQKTLMEEAAKLLKGVSLKPLRLASEGPGMRSLGALGIDHGWLVSAVTSASDPHYATMH